MLVSLRVADKGSQSQITHVQIQGVLANGIINTADNKTIIGGELFKKVAAVLHLQKQDLKPVYILIINAHFHCMDAWTWILVSIAKQCPHQYKGGSRIPVEGVCRQSEIVNYYQTVAP